MILPVSPTTISPPSVGGATVSIPTTPTSSPSGSGATGGAIPTTGISSSEEEDISRELGDFFYNLESAFESFAQLTNCAYPLTLSEADVTFNELIDEMGRRFPSERLTNCLISLRAKRWYRDMKRFRRCEYHRKCIPIYISFGHRFKERSWQKEIWLPDNPLAKNITYLKTREVSEEIAEIFTESLNVIDEMFRIIEARITVANSVPI